MLGDVYMMFGTLLLLVMSGVAVVCVCVCDLYIVAVLDFLFDYLFRDALLRVLAVDIQCNQLL